LVRNADAATPIIDEYTRREEEEEDDDKEKDMR
jgi:hypothetical protein